MNSLPRTGLPTVSMPDIISSNPLGPELWPLSEESSRGFRDIRGRWHVTRYISVNRINVTESMLNACTLRFKTGRI